MFGYSGLDLSGYRNTNNSNNLSYGNFSNFSDFNQKQNNKILNNYSALNNSNTTPNSQPNTTSPTIPSYTSTPNATQTQNQWFMNNNSQNKSGIPSLTFNPTLYAAMHDPNKLFSFQDWDKNHPGQ